MVTQPKETTTTISTKPTTTTKILSTGGICVNGDAFYPNYPSGCKKYFQRVYIGTAFAQIYTMSFPTCTLSLYKEWCLQVGSSSHLYSNV